MKQAILSFMTGIVFLMMLMNKSHAVTLKVAVLAPEGTTWATTIKDMAKEILQTTNGKVELKVFLGGVAGDEPDVLRKIRIGQLHGGIFTGRALGEINGDVRIMEVPFSFAEGDRVKAFTTLEKMTPYFDRGFEKQKFVNLGFYEIGNIYLVSTKRATSLENLKGLKIWAWSGDPLAEAMMNELKLVSVPLALPDVLSSLSTGIIEAAYASPLGIVALQWSTKVAHLLDYPITYSVGAFLLGQKAWQGIPAEHQEQVKKVINKYRQLANEGTIKENADALEALKGMGIQFNKMEKTDLATKENIRQGIIAKLTGKVFSKEAVQLFESNR
jgi:TRAP-type C4-dicarboxylate transport system substrate-binding protein